VFTQQTCIFPDNRKHERIFVAMAEVHSVQVVTRAAMPEQRGEVPLRLAESRQASGDYRIPSAQTSHPLGNKENGGNRRVRERSFTQPVPAAHTANTKQGKMAQRSEYARNVPVTVKQIMNGSLNRLQCNHAVNA
jgi:hypothetical protein